MLEPKRYQIDPRDIVVREDRDLPISDAAVEVIRQSARETGGIREDIHVRKVKGGVELIDGLHRRAAAIAEDMELVWVKEWACTLDDARLMEADANVTFTHTNPVDIAVGLAGRKRAYEKLHPETKQGVIGGIKRQNEQRTLMSFAEVVGQVSQKSPRQIRRIISAGESLTRDDIVGLRAVKSPLKMDDLYVIAKARGIEERRQIVDRLVSGEATSAAKAMGQIRSGDGQGKAVTADAAFTKLLELWKRTPKAMQRRSP